MTTAGKCTGCVTWLRLVAPDTNQREQCHLWSGEVSLPSGNNQTLSVVARASSAALPEVSSVTYLLVEGILLLTKKTSTTWSYVFLTAFSSRVVWLHAPWITVVFTKVGAKIIATLTGSTGELCGWESCDWFSHLLIKYFAEFGCSWFLKQLCSFRYLENQIMPPRYLLLGPSPSLPAHFNICIAHVSKGYFDINRKTQEEKVSTV